MTPKLDNVRLDLNSIMFGFSDLEPKLCSYRCMRSSWWQSVEYLARKSCSLSNLTFTNICSSVADLVSLKEKKIDAVMFELFNTVLSMQLTRRKHRASVSECWSQTLFVSSVYPREFIFFIRTEQTSFVSCHKRQRSNRKTDVAFIHLESTILVHATFQGVWKFLNYSGFHYFS